MEIIIPLTGVAHESRIIVTPANGVKKEFKSAVSAELVALSSLGFYLSDAVDGVFISIICNCRLDRAGIGNSSKLEYVDDSMVIIQ